MCANAYHIYIVCEHHDRDELTGARRSRSQAQSYVTDVRERCVKLAKYYDHDRAHEHAWHCLSYNTEIVHCSANYKHMFIRKPVPHQKPALRKYRITRCVALRNLIADVASAAASSSSVPTVADVPFVHQSQSKSNYTKQQMSAKVVHLFAATNYPEWLRDEGESQSM